MPPRDLSEVIGQPDYSWLSLQCFCEVPAKPNRERDAQVPDCHPRYKWRVTPPNLSIQHGFLRCDIIIFPPERTRGLCRVKRQASKDAVGIDRGSRMKRKWNQWLTFHVWRVGFSKLNCMGERRNSWLCDLHTDHMLWAPSSRTDKQHMIHHVTDIEITKWGLQIVVIPLTKGDAKDP